MAHIGQHIPCDCSVAARRPADVRYCGYCGMTLVWASQMSVAGRPPSDAGPPGDPFLLTKITRHGDLVRERRAARSAPRIASRRTVRPPAPLFERLVTIDRQSAHWLYCGFERRIRDGGLFIATSSPGEVGERIRVSFLVPGMNAPYTGNGRIAWVREDTARNADAVPGMGVALQSLPLAVEAALDRLINAREPIFYAPGDEPTSPSEPGPARDVGRPGLRRG